MQHKVLIQSLAFNELVSKICHASPYLFAFDLKTYTAHSPRKVWTPYNIANAILLLILWPLMNLYVMWKVFSPGAVSPSIAFEHVLTFSILLWGNGTNYFLIVAVDDMTYYTNCLIHLYSQLQPELFPVRWSRNLSDIVQDCGKELIRYIKIRRGDLLGVSLHIFIVGAILAPIPILLLVALCLHLHYSRGRTPISFGTFNLWLLLFGPGDWGELLAQLCTFLAYIMLSLELCRTCRVQCVSMFAVATVTIHFVSLIAETAKKDFMRALKQYQTLYLIHHWLRRELARVLYVYYQVGTMIIVLCWSAALVGWRFLAPASYWCSVMLSIALVFITYFSISLSLKILQLTEDMLHEWRSRKEVMCNPMKKRVVATLRPIGIPLANKGLIDTEVVRDGGSTIIFKTQDLILLFMTL